MSKIYKLALVGLSCVTLGACATVTRGTSEAWTVNTDPSGASVKTSIGFACDQTPCTFKLPRKSDFDVTIEKPGYTTLKTHVTNQVSSGGGAGMAGNVLLGGIIGAGVDVYSGAMLSLRPNPLTIKLEKVADQPPKPLEARAEPATTPVIPTSVTSPGISPAVSISPVAGSKPVGPAQ